MIHIRNSHDVEHERALLRFPGHPVDLACSRDSHGTIIDGDRPLAAWRAALSGVQRAGCSRIGNEKEPRAIRERWLAASVFINSALARTSQLARKIDRQECGREEARRIGGSAAKNEGKKQRIGRGESSTCSKSRGRMRMQIFIPGSRPPSEGTRNLCERRPYINRAFLL